MEIYDWISWWIWAGIVSGSGFMWAFWDEAKGYNKPKDVLLFYAVAALLGFLMIPLTLYSTIITCYRERDWDRL